MTGGPAEMLARQGEVTVTEASTRIGRSPDTVRRWIRNGKVTPRRVQCGSQMVAVFNEHELAELEAYSKTVKIGRPPVGLVPMHKEDSGE